MGRIKDNKDVGQGRLTMDPGFYKDNPFRPLQWRADRAMQMLAHQPSPLRPREYDDRPVRAYRGFLIRLLNAGGKEDARQALLAEQPYVYQAHMLRYGPDTPRRQILEARLLTRESLAQIAERFATKAPTIQYYEQLFFHVRDRLDNTDWIAKVILGTPESRAAGKNGVMTEGQRGFLYRLFAYHGGSLVLDAMISGMAAMMTPRGDADLGDWLHDSLRRILRSRAVAAAGIFEVNGSNVLRLLKLERRAAKRAAKSAKGGTPAPPVDWAEQAAAVMEQLPQDGRELMQPGSDASHQTGPAPVVEPCSGSEQRASMAERGPTGGAGDADPVNAARTKKTRAAVTQVRRKKAATVADENPGHGLPASLEPCDGLSELAPIAEVPVLCAE